MHDKDWSNSLIELLALASKLEGEGQYNLAKLCRAAADSMSRRAAYHLSMPVTKQELAHKIEQVAAFLNKTDFDLRAIVGVLNNGAGIMAEGRLPLIKDTPNVFVCRICGHLELGQVLKPCPTCQAWPETFQEFIPVYWLNVLDPFEALKKLHQTPIEIEELLAGLPNEMVEKQIEDGSWAVRNLVTHFRDAQQVLNYRVNLMLKEEDPVLESQAVFEWAENEDAQALSTEQLFNYYRSSRADTLAVLEKLPLKDWWRTGFHEEFGKLTLKQQVSYFASHELTHLSQLQKMRDQIIEISN
jgi:hypothetical protein